jgi:F0F1-type ATP synthase assembly protein I
LDLRGLRDVNTGLGDGLAAAFELIATPFIFGFLGYLLDRRLGTHLVFMFTFAFVVFGYEVWKLVSRYLTEMDAHQASAKWSRAGRDRHGDDWKRASA